MSAKATKQFGDGRLQIGAMVGLIRGETVASVSL
jgi:hypothetical protein